MFKQPRVPEYRENEGAAKHLRALTLFLKDFCQDVWTASRNTDKGLAGISYPVTSVNGKTGAVKLTVDDVGARASSWLPSPNDIKTMTFATWNGNTTPANIPNGISYATAANEAGHGFPVGYCTVFAVKENTARLVQLLINKTEGKLYIRSATDGTTWGEWKKYITSLDAYPVGSIFISTNSTSPASLFGGTWEQLKDRFLLGAGDTYSGGETGGTAEETLNNTQIPNHTHKIARGNTAAGTTTFPANSISIFNNACQVMSASGNRYISLTGTNATNGGGSHNNMPPYLVVYMWKRVS